MHKLSVFNIRQSVFTLALALWASGLGAGCPHRPVIEEPPPTPPTPPEEQVATFQEIVGELESAAGDGWDEAECRRISGRFVELSDQAHGRPEALFNAGLVMRRCGLEQEAAELLERANETARRLTEGSPGFAPALLLSGADAYRRGDRERAQQLFDAARQADPRSAMAYTNLATLQREDRQWAEAQRNIRRALAVDSDSVEAYTQMALLYFELAQENTDVLDLTALVCQQAVARASETRVAAQKLAPIHNVWGLALVRKGDVVGAVAQFDKARQLNPALFESHMNFGAINLSFRGYQEAERAFTKALEIRPDSYEANISYGVALRGLRRFEEANRAYEKAVQIDPDRPDAYYNQGVLAQDYLLGQATESADRLELLRAATRAYERFIDACGRSPEACQRRGLDDHTEDLRQKARQRIDDCRAIEEVLIEAES